MTTELPEYEPSPRVIARHLYWQGWRVVQIAQYLDCGTTQVHNWKTRDGWKDARPLDRVESAIEARLLQLVSKFEKEPRDFKEIDLLGRQIERMARVRNYEKTGQLTDLNPKIGGKQSKPRRKNTIDDEQAAKLEMDFLESLFAYQRKWYEAGQQHRIRNILKSRQIGATWYFAREAVVDAAKNGRNKLFLSASRAQANIFKNYIQQFVKQSVDVELRGDPIVLDNGAELHFLSTNSATAQGYHGDVYLDEYFWLARFREFRKVVSGMAMHKKWRQTYFSTPSSVGHEAYPFWTGKLFNQRRKKADRVEIDVSHKALVHGHACADAQWRQIVTVEDAIAGGCDLFDLEQLRMEYSPEEFSNLLMCQFVDDSESAFPMTVMHGCMVDSWDVWNDYRPFAPRPMGDAPVWIGYDPTGSGEDGDGAGLVVVAASQKKSKPHRVTERHRLRGQDYEAQDKFIREIAQRYNVEHIGIDVSGLGDAVAQLVAKWFPTVTRYQYTPVVKTQMVMHTQQIIRKNRLEFDAGWSDLAQSFMAIKRVMTNSGRQITYHSGRNSQTGHADLAWATMHALHHEPIDGPQSEQGRSILEISG